jgi:uncharacterized protein (TIGR02145 family)
MKNSIWKLTFFIALFSCSKDSDNGGATGTLPVVSTDTVQSITDTSALGSGTILIDSITTISTRGFCWSTSPNPSIALPTKTIDVGGSGSFTALITGLSASTTYHVRAYATSAAGTAYGQDILFTTKPATANLENVSIGNQTWSLKNLNVITYRNGDPIPHVTDPNQWKNLTSGAWCWFNNDSANYAAVYGRLYNWYAVNDSRGLAPQGWRIPKETDWNRLIKFLDPTADTACTQCTQSSSAGGALKEQGTIHWNYNNTNIGATNSSGFTALPAGSREETGIFNSLSQAVQLGYFWSADSAVVANKAWTRLLYAYDKEVGKYYVDKRSGRSIRVIKD